ncbi:MAG: ABC transporter ATP-binding protein [Bacteroidota bacterium]
MKTYLRLLNYMRPFGRFLVPFFLLTLAANFFNVFQFTLIIPLLNFLFQSDSGLDAAKYSAAPSFEFSKDFFIDYFNYTLFQLKDNNPLHALYFIAAVVVIAVLCTNLFTYFANRKMVKARTLLVKNIREAIYEKVNHLHIGYFTKEHKGDLISRMNSDVYEIEAVASSAIDVIFKQPYLIIAYFIALFLISTKLTLFTLIIIPVSALGIAFVTKRLKKEAQETQLSAGRMLTMIDETLMGMRIIRSFNATRFVINRFRAENDHYRKTILKSFAKKELAPAFSEVSGVAVVTAILIYGGSMILQNKNGAGLSPGAFIAFLAIFSQVIRPAKAMVVAFANIQRGQAAGERILQVIDTPVEVEDRADAKELRAFNDKIEFRNIRFGYSDKIILEDISFVLPKAKTVALIGPSGVGKSTLADLLPRFYDVKGGSITIDGTDIRAYKMESLRSHMSFVTQDTMLFNDTIFNNIALGKPDASLEDVMAAAKIANAHDFIINTENGYYTNIGDRGVRLSGGQRQRLSIARAVFKNPEILILDEATSALDTESEKLVQEALTNLMKGRTTLVIAHRLSTIQDADEIIVLQGGRIIERGKHIDLIENEDGIYKKLTILQKVG